MIELKELEEKEAELIKALDDSRANSIRLEGAILVTKELIKKCK